jgi:enoyl-CoA hydratase/carnithine racemase
VSFDRLPSDLLALGAGFAAVGRRLTGDVRVVVLRGRDWSAVPPAVGVSAGGCGPAVEAVAAERRLEAVQAGTAWLSGRADLLSVAVLDGVAEGFGLDLALACDLRVACEHAVLRWPAAGSGPPALFGGQDALFGLVGYPRALEWRIAGRVMPAPEAVGAGLVSRAAPAELLDDCVEELVASLLAASRDAAVEAKASLLHARRARGAAPAAQAEQREAYLRLARPDRSD